MIYVGRKLITINYIYKYKECIQRRYIYIYLYILLLLFLGTGAVGESSRMRVCTRSLVEASVC